MSVEMSIGSQLRKHPLTLTHPTSTGFTQTFRFTRDDRNFRPKEHDNYDDSSADLKAAALKKKKNSVEKSLNTQERKFRSK